MKIIERWHRWRSSTTWKSTLAASRGVDQIADVVNDQELRPDVVGFVFDHRGRADAGRQGQGQFGSTQVLLGSSASNLAGTQPVARLGRRSLISINQSASWASR